METPSLYQEQEQRRTMYIALQSPYLSIYILVYSCLSAKQVSFCVFPLIFFGFTKQRGGLGHDTVMLLARQTVFHPQLDQVSIV